MTDQAPLTDDDLLALFEGALPNDAAHTMLARLQKDPAAQAKLAAWGAQNDALAALYPVQSAADVPARLTAVIQSARFETVSRPAPPWRGIAAVLALLAIGLGAGWALRSVTGADPSTRSLATAAQSAHATFVGEVRHPVEVLASDRAHLNTWMSKRLGRDMAPPDLAAAGFALLGGRVVPAEAGTAGMYMYENAEGLRVTLYVQPQAAQGATSFQFAQGAGVQSYSWTDEGLGCAMVGDLPRETLRALAEAAYDQLI